MIVVHIRSESERALRRVHGLAGGLPTSEQAGHRAGLSRLEGVTERVIAPGIVLDEHSHRGVEILTYVVDGVLGYRESAGERLLLGGEVQLVSAGRGVTHSERNASNSDPLHVVQAWIRPDRRDAEPGYAQRYVSEEDKRERLCLIAAADGRHGALPLGADVDVYAATLESGEPVVFRRRDARRVWLQVARGEMTVNNVGLAAGDAATVDGADERELHLRGHGEAELLLFDLP